MTRILSHHCSNAQIRASFCFLNLPLPTLPHHFLGLQPKWPLWSFEASHQPHAFYKSVHLEVVAVLHYNNHDGVIDWYSFYACVSKCGIFGTKRRSIKNWLL